MKKGKCCPWPYEQIADTKLSLYLKGKTLKHKSCSVFKPKANLTAFLLT